MSETNGNGMGELAAALAKAQAAFPKFVKEHTAEVESKRTGQTFTYKYGDLASLIEVVRKPLADNGLAYVQLMEVVGEGHHVLLTRLLHTSGAYLDSRYALASHDKPQEMGSEITYARRYTLAALLGVAAEVDDDGAAAQNGAPKRVPNFYRGTPPKSNVPAELVGQPDRPKGAPTTDADAAANFPKSDDEDRPFLLDGCKRKVEEFKFSGREREALKKAYLDGHAADLASPAKLRGLYLFLGDREAVEQFRAEQRRLGWTNAPLPTPKAEAP